jgi:hypothetical protein
MSDKEEYFRCRDVVRQVEGLVEEAEMALTEYVLNNDSYNNETLDILKANIEERILGRYYL